MKLFHPVLFIIVVINVAIGFCAATTKVNMKPLTNRASVNILSTNVHQPMNTASNIAHQSDTGFINIELKSSRYQFILQLRPLVESPDNPMFSPGYEEVEHDVSRDKPQDGAVNSPSLRYHHSPQSTSQFQSCLYEGSVVGEPKSFVSLSTCSGTLTGMIFSRGQFFSVEDDQETVHQLHEQESFSHQPRHASNHYIVPLAMQRDVARKQGIVSLLQQFIPFVSIVSVQDEAREIYRAEGTAPPEISMTPNKGTLSRSTPTKRSNSCGPVSPVSAKVLAKSGFDQRAIDHFLVMQRDQLEGHRSDHSMVRSWLRAEKDTAAKSHSISTQSSDDNSDDDDHQWTEAELADWYENQKPALSYPHRFIELVLYHDYARLQSFNTTGTASKQDLVDAARQDGVSLFHQVRSIYLHGRFHHNVTVVLKGHVFFTNGDPYRKYHPTMPRYTQAQIANMTDAQRNYFNYQSNSIQVMGSYGLLENFNLYRSAYGHRNHDAGILLSGLDFEGRIRGLSNVGSSCSGPRWNGNINMHYRNPVMRSVLVTHEIGHVFSAMHDTRAGHIMFPYVSADTTFSIPSKRSIDYYLSQTRCTVNNPRDVNEFNMIQQSIGSSSHGYLTQAAAKLDSPDHIYSDVAEESSFAPPIQEALEAHFVGGRQPQKSRVGHGDISYGNFLLACGAVAFVTMAISLSTIIGTLCCIRMYGLDEKLASNFARFVPSRVQRKPVDINDPDNTALYPDGNVTPASAHRVLPPDTPTIHNTPLPAASPAYSESLRRRSIPDRILEQS